MKKLPEKINHLLVRHAAVSNRGDFDRIAAMASPGFENSSSVASDSTIHGSVVSSERWTIVSHFQSEPWVSLFSSEPLEGVYAANAEARRLEVLLLQRDGDSLKFFVTKQKKSVVKLIGEIGRKPGILDCSDAELAVLLAELEDSQQVFDALCETYEVSLPQQRVDVENNEFRVLGKRGRPIKGGIKKYVVFFGRGGLPRGSNNAAELMEVALEKVSPDLVREALDAGAPLDKLPEKSSSPLFVALCKFHEKPEWKECAEILIAAGADVNEVDRFDNPLIVQCTDHIFHDEHAAAIVELLAKHGVDANKKGRNDHALVSCSLRNKLSTVTALVSAGADPSMAVCYDGTPLIEELHRRLERDLKYRSNSKIAKVLQLLGENVELPQVEELSAEFARENTRFADVKLADHILQALSVKMNFQAYKASRLGRTPEYQQWSKELVGLGFELAASMTVKGSDSALLSAFTDPVRKFDAIICDSGMFQDPLIKLEIGAYKSDGKYTWVMRNPVVENPRFPSRIHDRTVVPEGSPAELVAKLEELTGNTEIKPVSAEDFVDRYKAVYEDTLEDVRKYARDIKSDRLRRSDGTIPRYERMGRYIELPDMDERPDFSSRKLTDYELETALNVDGDEEINWMVSSVARLMVSQHLQYVGSPRREEYVLQGLASAVKLFESYSTDADVFESTWPCDYLSVAWMLAFVSEDDGAFRKICGSLKPRFARRKNWERGYTPVEVAEVQLLIAQSFRETTIRGVKKIPDAIRAGSSARGKLTLGVWDSIQEKDSDAFSKQFPKLLKSTIKSNEKNPKNDSRFSIQLAWMESVLWHLAKRAGLELPDLPIDQLDWLITPESLA